MLTHIRCDVSISIFGHVVQSLNDLLRLDDLGVFAVVLHAIALAPAVDGGPPSTQCIAVGFEARLFDHGNEFGQNIFDIAHNRYIDLHTLGNAGRVNVNVNNLALVLCKVFGIANDAVVKARAHSQQHVRVLHGVVGFPCAVHAEHAKELWIGSGIGAQAHEGVGHGVTQHVDQLAQLC